MSDPGPKRNLVWPVTLIVVGLLFLAHNLGFLAYAQLKDLIATWWPLILIALGVAGFFGRR